MSETANDRAWVEVPDLATEACDAAIQLDHLIRGGSWSDGRLGQFADRLEQEIPLVESLATSEPMSMVTMMAVYRACKLLYEDCPQTIKGLAQWVRVMTALLRTAAPHKEKMHLRWLRTFCLEVSRNAF